MNVGMFSCDPRLDETQNISVCVVRHRNADLEGSVYVISPVCWVWCAACVIRRDEIGKVEFVDAVPARKGKNCVLLCVNVNRLIDVIICKRVRLDQNVGK